MVEAQLPFPAEPMPRIRGQKPDNAFGRDSAPGADFSAAVSLEAGAGNAEEARPRGDQPLETVSLDPDLDADEAVAALSQAVAAFIVSEASPGTRSDSPQATGADATLINASPVAQLRAALPGLAGMASVAAGTQEPSGLEQPGTGTPPSHATAVKDASTGKGEADSVGPGNRVDPVPAEAVPDPELRTAVQAEPLRLPDAASPVALTAVARAMAAVSADNPARPLDPVRQHASRDAAPASGIGVGTENVELLPGAGEVRVVTTATDHGQRPPAVAISEAGKESAGTDRSPVVSAIRDGAQTQPSIAMLPADTNAAQQILSQPSQSAAPDTDPAGKADAGEVAPARGESPPSRPASEIGSSLRNALPAGEAAKAQAGGQVLANPTATIFFAQLPGLAAAQAASPAEQLRPILPVRGDFSTGAPLRHLEIVLAPPELGTVRVVITREEGEMRVEMIASTSQAIDMLESARESMVEAIRDTGLRAGSIEIRQDLQAARPTGTGDFANGSAWNGRHEQGRQEGAENWQATRGHSYGQAVRTAESGAQNQGLIL